MEWAGPSRWSGRRVLVTGASGFIGREVCRLLVAAGAVVHGTGWTRPAPPGVEPHRARLPGDAAAVVASARPEVILHLACPVGLDPDPSLYDSLREGILDGTAALAAVAGGARFVHVGSCDEYGAGEAPFGEDSPPRPTTPYGALKAAASAWVGWMVRQGRLDATVLRPFRAFGPHDRSSIVARACAAAVAGRPLDLTSGEQVREWNPVGAIAAGILAAAAHPGARGAVLNLGGGPRLSVREIALVVFRIAGADPSLVRAGALPRRPGEPDAFFGDHRRAEALWGPLPRPPLEAALDETLAWHRSLP